MVKHTISTIGSHSALDISEGAKREGFRTLVVAQRGREKPYIDYYKTRKRGNREIGVVDEIVLVDKFKDMATEKIVKYLKEKNAIWIPNRSFAVYVGYDNIENNFDIPIFGNRKLLRAEERDVPNNQYDLLEKSGIPFPKRIKRPQDIDDLVVVKVNEAKRKYERAFFLANSYEEYKEKSDRLLKEGKITEEDLEKARIEEFIIGAPFNFNFFYSKVYEELELLGVDTRRQTTLDGYLHMPADTQLEVLKTKEPRNIEVGHIACTVRESLLRGVFEQAEKFVKTVEKEYPPGLIGPFALQGAIREHNGREEFVTFDVSFRMPGSPGTRFTPYSEYLFRESISFGRRIAIEIKDAEDMGMIDNITT